jgi:hypothetical protein
LLLLLLLLHPTLLLPLLWGFFRQVELSQGFAARADAAYERSDLVVVAEGPARHAHQQVPAELLSSAGI